MSHRHGTIPGMTDNSAPAPGDRIELITCTDEHTTLRPGARGTVTLVDDTGTVFAAWDNGSTLGLLPGIDTYRVLPDPA